MSAAPSVTLHGVTVTLSAPGPAMRLVLSEALRAAPIPAATLVGTTMLAACWPRGQGWPGTPRPHIVPPRVSDDAVEYGGRVFDELIGCGVGEDDLLRAVTVAMVFIRDLRFPVPLPTGSGQGPAPAADPAGAGA